MPQFFKLQILHFTPVHPCSIWLSFVVKVFSFKNRFSILSLQFCLRLQVIRIFWIYHTISLNSIGMYVDVVYALDSINSKLQKWFLLLPIFSIKIWYFWSLSGILPNKRQKSVLYYSFKYVFLKNHLISKKKSTNLPNNHLNW